MSNPCRTQVHQYPKYGPYFLDHEVVRLVAECGIKDKNNVLWHYYGLLAIVLTFFHCQIKRWEEDIFMVPFKLSFGTLFSNKGMM